MTIQSHYEANHEGPHFTCVICQTSVTPEAATSSAVAETGPSFAEAKGLERAWGRLNRHDPDCSARRYGLSACTCEMAERIGR